MKYVKNGLIAFVATFAVMAAFLMVMDYMNGQPLLNAFTYSFIWKVTLILSAIFGVVIALGTFAQSMQPPEPLVIPRRALTPNEAINLILAIRNSGYPTTVFVPGDVPEVIGDEDARADWLVENQDDIEDRMVAAGNDCIYVRAPSDEEVDMERTSP